MKTIPLPMIWTDDGCFKPLERYAKRADQQYAVGEVYRLTVEEERSAASHRSYFASLKFIHDNLPDALFERFPTVEAFRKRCLIRTGFFSHRHVVCSSERQAETIAAMLGEIDEYALVEIRGNVLEIYRARSQSVQAMKKDEFEDSKRKVLELGVSLIGITLDALRQESRAHAEPRAVGRPRQALLPPPDQGRDA